MKLVVIAKAPEPGSSKTRLCPPCTPEQAADIARASLLDTLETVSRTPCDERVLVLEGEPDGWIPAGFTVVKQRGLGLDERLAAAFEDAGGPALVIGMDTPQVTPGLLASALDALGSSGAVLGPAADGGYWAIGLHTPERRALVGVPMSTTATFGAQLARLESLEVSVSELPVLKDVDTFDDALAVANEVPGSRFAAEVATVASAVRFTGRRTLLLLAGLAASIVVWFWVGRYLSLVADVKLWTRSPPLTGGIDPGVSWRLIPALLLGGATVWWGARVTRSLAWGPLLGVAFVAATAWGAALAFTDGAHGFIATPAASGDYLASLPFVGNDPLGFLRGFVDSLPAYSLHARSHPPGMLLILFGMDRVGLVGPAWLAVLQMLGAGAAAPAALVAVREFAGPRAAGAAAPFLVVLPAAVWWSAADAFFMGGSAWAVTLLVSATGRSGARSRVLALSGGALLAATVFLSYGLALVALVPLAVAWRRRRLDVLAVAAVPVALAILAFGLAGFWWWDGLAASKHEYDVFVTRTRPYWYFLVANPLAFAIALGPAVVALAARPREPGVWPLVAGGLAAALLANLSGLSKGEVERIWLPFVPWVVVATAAYSGRSEGEVRGWLGAQVGTAVALQTFVRSPW